MLEEIARGRMGVVSTLDVGDGLLFTATFHPEPKYRYLALEFLGSRYSVLAIERAESMTAGTSVPLLVSESLDFLASLNAERALILAGEMVEENGCSPETAAIVKQFLSMPERKL